MSNISVVILTKNEEKNILDCIEGLYDCDEIVIIDDYSEDRTEEIVRNLKKEYIKIYKRKIEGDFSEQRNFGLSKTKGDWVLFVDADERVSKELFDEVRHVVANNEANAFLIKRRDVMWGKELKHGETGDIKLVRLAKKDVGKWQGKVHEVWKINGKVDTLKSSLTHFPHPTIAEFLTEINSYSTIRAEELKKSGKSASMVSIVAYAKAKFFVDYFLKLGFLDGVPGLIIALMMSFHSFLSRAKLWQINH